MRFLKNTLQPHEHPVCRSRLHGIYLFSGFMWLAFLAGLGWGFDILLWTYFGAYIPEYEYNNSLLHIGFNPGILGWLCTAGGGLILLSQLVKFFSTHIVVTTRRLIYKTGLIHVEVDATEIADILGAHVDQGWFGQFFGYGRLHLDCRFIEDVYIPYIKNPYGLVKAVQKIRAAGMDSPLVHEKTAEAPAATMQPVSQTLIQISGNNPVYIVDKVPNDPKLPLTQLPKNLGDNMRNTFRRKA